jgi:RNA polymerase primary sigma factor
MLSSDSVQRFKRVELDSTGEEIFVDRQTGNDTERSSLSTVSRYLEEIGKTPLLTREEEVGLGKKIQEGKRNFIHRAVEAAGLIKDNSYLLSLFERKGAAGRDLDNVERDLDRVREIADFLEAERNKLRQIKPEEARERVEQILEEIKKARSVYETNRKKMMEANLRLVVSFAKKYTGRGVPFSDLIQEGNIGLSRAVDKFDYKSGKRFSTYASWWIRQALSRAITDQSQSIRIPVHIAHLMRKLSRISRQLEQELGRQPSSEEIAEWADIPLQRIRETMEVGQATVSIDTLVGEDKDTPMIDFVSNSSIPPPVYKLTLDMLKEEVRGLLEEVIKDERESDILKLRFGLEKRENHSLREIGRKYGVSRERIRQIQERALSKLRVEAEKRGLRSYLELLDMLRTTLEKSYAD